MKRVYKLLRIMTILGLVGSLYYTAFSSERALAFPGVEQGWLNEQRSSFYSPSNMVPGTPYAVVLKGPADADFDLCILENGVRTTPCSNSESSIESLTSIWNETNTIEVDAWSGSGSYTISLFRDCVQLRALSSASVGEWIEIQNVCVEEKEITGYRISNRNATFVIGDMSLLGRETARFFPSSYNPSGSPFGLSIVDTGLIELYDPKGQLVDECTYSESLLQRANNSEPNCLLKNPTSNMSGELNRLTFSN